ncbi:MAG: secondary thiamine-phosphate synthase enzyme YjbQ [Pseudomonadota bacterium]
MAERTTTFEVYTTGPGFYEITGHVQNWIANISAGSARVTLFVQHTSCSLLIQENADPDVQTDLLAWLERLAPPADHPSMSYLRHVTEGPDDMPAHIKASVLPTSLTIPVLGGRMALGTWQGIYVVEHRTQSHHRRVVATLD